MTLSLTQTNDILTFWFPNNNYNKFWFEKNEEIDIFINNNFKELINYVNSYDINDIIYYNKNEILAIIILLDQFSRNIQRIDITFKVYDMTLKAYELSQIWIKNKYYLTESIQHTVFALMPLRHINKITDYILILNILDEIKHIYKNNEIYKKFIYQTKKRFELLKI